MEIEIIKELLKQYSLVSAAIAFIITIIFNLGVFYVNQKIMSAREIRLEQARADLEKGLAEFKAIKLTEAENIQQTRWEMKHRACLDAMEIVDSYLSHFFESVEGIPPVRQQADTVNARNCLNELAFSCKSPKVYESFLKMMSIKPDTNIVEITENINTLRNTIRTELGFGNKIKLSNELAWFVRLAGDNRESVIDTTKE